MKDLSFADLQRAVEAAEPAEDGSVTAVVPVESIGNAASRLIRFGDQLEVLDPPELRAELRRLAQSVADLYEA